MHQSRVHLGARATAHVPHTTAQLQIESFAMWNAEHTLSQLEREREQSAVLL